MGIFRLFFKVLPPAALFLFIFANFYFFWVQASFSLFELPVFSTFILVLVAYTQCILTNPGKVPNNFDFIEESSKKRLVHCEFTSELKPAFASFCEKCLKGRPARSHHCSKCGVCVLKRDHHCMWINNCVGLLNHKHFIHLIGYGAMTTSLISCALYPPLKENYEKSSNFEIFGFFLNFSTCVALTFMTIYHLWLVLTNRTMIEFRFKLKPSIFDINLQTNLTTQFGSNKLAWFFPVTPSLSLLYSSVKLQKPDKSSEILSNIILLPSKE